jgi:hypothetical protein
MMQFSKFMQLPLPDHEPRLQASWFVHYGIVLRVTVEIELTLEAARGRSLSTEWGIGFLRLRRLP